MTKREMMNAVIQSDKFKAIEEQLDALVKADKITSGAAYYVYSLYDNYGYKMMSEVLMKLAKSKSRYYLDNYSTWSITYYYKEFMKGIEKAEQFIAEQNSLPFEQTQKQVLAAKGELI